ncbi:hypothetical protein BLNAU_19810 [Blattamonas nauphoetae]|uniref:Uncharacterized protein n=1 Tax=Blattamonas nauphoetae TaxID=2049346 RepID=A0ABQ9X1K9_9EUKA|nr:hypothetical protein BLNAU_19810 [Blattamonas nauphoetae]
MFPLVQKSKRNTKELRSSEVLLALIKRFHLPLEPDISNCRPNFLSTTVLDQLVNDLHPSFFPILLLEFVKMSRKNEIRALIAEKNVCKLIDNMNVASSPELAIFLAMFLDSAGQFDFPFSRLEVIPYSNENPREVRTSLVLAYLLVYKRISLRNHDDCVSALLLHLSDSPSYNFTNTLVDAIHLNIGHLFRSHLSAKRIPSLIRALLDFEAALPVVSGITEVEIAVQVDLSRHRVLTIILALLNLREPETTQNQTRTDDDFRYFHLYRGLFLNDSEARLHYKTNGSFSIMKESPFPRVFLSTHPGECLSSFVMPSSISMEQKSLLVEIAPSIISRITELIPHFMDRARWLNTLDQVGLNESVCLTAINIIASLSALTPEIEVSQLAHLLSQFVWSRFEKVFLRVRQAFVFLSTNSNRSEFLLRLRVNQKPEQASIPTSPADEQEGHNLLSPPPPLTSQPAHQPIAEIVSPTSPDLPNRLVSTQRDDKTIPLLKVFVQRGLFFFVREGIGILSGAVNFETLMKILDEVNHQSRMTMLTYLVEELVDRREISLAGIREVIVGLKSFAPQLSDLILPLSRLVRFSNHIDLSEVRFKACYLSDIRICNNHRPFRLNDIVQMVVWIMSTPIERKGDVKTFIQLASLLSSALISSLITLPAHLPNFRNRALPLPVGSNKIGNLRVGANRASVWKTSLLEEGLFDFLGFFFDEGIEDCVSFFGFNCTFPIHISDAFSNNDSYFYNIYNAYDY